ncbi:transglycosylase family protein [Actinomycetospora termitidis]|uniref:Transglycosylase family protein n=1 Tax=Actinomycetospora termitidis TaxID=3053470 RepID=A0ABT7MC28_9PSEU|nr:transglycosylase family protein [Actinomycetospora sp. Odt1-22]MDL5157542.1 transglycosylase family protein [Actinomycetospora sp. Odt1-22]
MLRSTDESLARALTRKAAQLTLVGALAATPLALAAGTASADTDWDALAKCESSGKWSTNTGNGFSGGLQFTPSTWKAFGGSGSAHNASREEQIQVAERVKASQGMKAWPTCSKKTGQTSNKANSEGSSSKSGSSGSTSSKKSGETESIKAPAPSAVAPAGGYTVASGDTLSSIASAHGVSWQQIAQRNAITNPDTLSVGQQLALS